MEVGGISTSLKMSMGSDISNPMSDKALFNKENKRLYKIILLFLILDFILNELILFNDSDIISSDDKRYAFILFFVFSLLTIFIYGLLSLFLYLKKVLLNKITRFSYLIIGILFYIYQVLSKLVFFSDKKFNLKPFDIIIFITIALTIIPRIVGFIYMKIYERTIIRIDNAKIAEEHENFIEKVVNKLDRSTTNNLKENELEKELDKSSEEEEEIIFKMNKDKVVVDTNNNQNKNENNKNRKKTKEEENEEEVADLS